MKQIIQTVWRSSKASDIVKILNTTLPFLIQGQEKVNKSRQISVHSILKRCVTFLTIRKKAQNIGYLDWIGGGGLFKVYISVILFWVKCILFFVLYFMMFGYSGFFFVFFWTVLVAFSNGLFCMHFMLQNCRRVIVTWNVNQTPCLGKI